MAGTFPQAWEEVCLVAISKFVSTGDKTIEAMAMSETVDISQGDYPFESVPNIAGGRIGKQSSEEDGEITLEFYPVYVEDVNGTFTSNVGMFAFFAGGTSNTTEPRGTDTSWGAGVSRVRDRFRVTVLWTDDINVTSAESATTATDSVALRFSAMGCRMVSHKADFTDGILKVTVTFKYPAMNQAGDTKMWKWESTNDGDTTPLVVLPDYDDEDSWS